MLYDPKWTPPATEIKLEPWQEILLKAATILEEKGWVQDGLHSPKGFCALGALQWACYGQVYTSSVFNKTDVDGKRERHNDVYIQACHNLGNAVRDWDIYHWNDNPGRTAKEVIDQMRTVANAV